MGSPVYSSFGPVLMTLNGSVAFHWFPFDVYHIANTHTCTNKAVPSNIFTRDDRLKQEAIFRVLRNTQVRRTWR